MKDSMLRCLQPEPALGRGRYHKRVVLWGSGAEVAGDDACAAAYIQNDVWRGYWGVDDTMLYEGDKRTVLVGEPTCSAALCGIAS